MSLLKELGLLISGRAINIARLTALHSESNVFALRAQCGQDARAPLRQFLLKRFLQS